MNMEAHNTTARHDGSGRISRRELLATTSCGLGSLAFLGLHGSVVAREARRQRAREEGGYENPLAPKSPHFAARARRVIFLFMQGGPSHVDTFDHKPELQKQAGRATGGKGARRGKLLASPWKFSRHGDSGLPISELFPALSRHADSLCLLNGMHTDNPAHPQATIMLHTGSINFVRPSAGAWTVYGLGTENEDLPGFITINPTPRLGGAQNYGSAFLPACFQGTRIGVGRQPARPRRRRGTQTPATMPHIRNPELSPAEQRRQIDLIQLMNRDLLQRVGVNREIDGIIESYELAFRMQTRVPEVMDLESETPTTLESYGIGRGKPGDTFGRQCLMARRFSEAGVRFIEIHHGGWDQHNNLKTRLTANAAATDGPIAGLLGDLKERGLLDETLVVWGGEFGRTPQGQNAAGDGRRHNNRGYTMWLAGGGVRGGIRHGATDEIGARAVQDKVHVHDLHATILHLLGLDHQRLTYRYAGRDFRLTDVHGHVVHDIIA